MGVSRKPLEKKILESMLVDQDRFQNTFDRHNDQIVYSNALLSRIVYDPKDLSMILEDLAFEMENGGHHLQLIYLYLHQGFFSKALSVVNDQLTNATKDTTRPVYGGAVLQRYIDIGRNILARKYSSKSSTEINSNPQHYIPCIHARDDVLTQCKHESYFNLLLLYHE